jgi:hypothetical protein
MFFYRCGQKGIAVGMPDDMAVAGTRDGIVGAGYPRT